MNDKKALKGGEFLIRETEAQDIFIPEEFFVVAVYSLPSGRYPKVRCKRVFQAPSDISYQLIIPLANNTHRVVHGYFMEGMGCINFIPLFIFFFRIIQDWFERSSMCFKGI